MESDIWDASVTILSVIPVSLVMKRPIFWDGLTNVENESTSSPFAYRMAEISMISQMVSHKSVRFNIDNRVISGKIIIALSLAEPVRL